MKALRRVVLVWRWLFFSEDVALWHQRPPRLDNMASTALVMVVNTIILGFVMGQWWPVLGAGSIALGSCLYSLRARACFHEGMQAGRDGLTQEIVVAMVDHHIPPEEYVLRELTFAEDMADAARQVRRSRKD